MSSVRQLRKLIIKEKRGGVGVMRAFAYSLGDKLRDVIRPRRMCTRACFIIVSLFYNGMGGGFSRVPLFRAKGPKEL